MPQRALPTRKKPRRTRQSACARGYDRRWRKARLGWLKSHPLCVACERQEKVTAATEVDHIREHAGQDDPLFWDTANWQSLCKPCHSRKTVRSR